MMNATLATALAGIAALASAAPSLAQANYDTAGVTVVQNPSTADTTFGWTVDPEPQLEIGGAENDARYQLYRVVDAARLSDGRIVVANAGTYEVRFYYELGEYASAGGGEGEGPGEFSQIWGIEVGTNDSIYVFDHGLQRLSVFDSSGQLGRDFSLLSATPPVAAVGRFADEHWYVRDQDRLQPGLAGEIRRDTTRYTGFDASFEKDFLIVTLPGMMTASFRAGGNLAVRWAPFSPSPAHDVFGNCLYVIAGDDFDVRIFSSRGQLVRIVHNAGEPEAVSEGHRIAWIDDALGAQVPEAARPQVRRAMEHIPTPEKLPVYNDVIVDAHGYVWLQEYTPLIGPGRYWTGSGRWWVVLDPRGKLLGRVKMPVVLDVFDIGSDYVLGRWQDENGEESVRMYRLRAYRDPHLQPPVQCTVSG